MKIIKSIGYTCSSVYVKICKRPVRYYIFEGIKKKDAVTFTSNSIFSNIFPNKGLFNDPGLFRVPDAGADAFFVNCPDGGSRNLHGHPTVFLFDIELLDLEVWVEFPFGFDIGMGNAVAAHCFLSGKLTDSGHNIVLLILLEKGVQNSDIILDYARGG